MHRDAPPPRAAWPLAALLFALTLGLYWHTGDFGFLNYDDDVYVTENPAVRGGLAWDGLRWAFTTGHAANWHPLTWLSHQLDVECFGLEAGAHHRVNAGLHALNAALCCLALAALTGARVRSALAAALFALHPLRVESVAWVAERKDLLAGACAFACLLAYARYARRGAAGSYVLALVLFALGLMAKPMLVTLPCLLLVLDVWPLGRLSVKPPRGSPVPSPSPAPTHPGERAEVPRGRSRYGVFLEKLPFLALAAASAIVTLVVQRAGGAFGPLEAVPFAARAANALESYGLYLTKTLVPAGLCAFHPHPWADPARGGAWSPEGLLGLAALLGLAWAGFRLRARAPFVLVGWLWFAGLLVPVAGLVQVGLHGWAERYTYLPSVGLALAAVWSVAALARSERARAAALAAGLGALALLALASARQSRTWRDSRTLFEHAAATDESPVAHNNLGRACEAERDLPAAERHYRRACELAPELAGARVNLARVLAAHGRRAEAERELEQAVASAPELAPAHADLGWLRVEAGRDGEALPHLRRAHELAPANPALTNDLAWVLATSPSHASPEEALALAEELVRTSRGAQAAYLETLAAALAHLGRFEEAAAWQARAVERVRAPQRGPLEERLALYRSGRPYLRSP